MKRLIVCLLLAAIGGGTSTAQDSVSPLVDQKLESVFKQLVIDGYEKAKLQNEADVFHLEREKQSNIETLNAELAATKAESTGKFRVFKSIREKSLRERELEIRLHRVRQLEPNPTITKWVDDNRLRDISEVSAIEAMQLYSVRSVEIAQITGKQELHGLVRIKDGSRPYSDDYTFQRVKIIWNTGTENLYEGKPLLTDSTLFVCTGIETYETTRGDNRIPVLMPCGAAWKKYVETHVPAEDREVKRAVKEKEISNEMREWKDTTGKFKVTAELVGATETTVDLKKADGSVATVKKSILSLPDNLYIEAMKLADLPFKSLRDESLPLDY